MSLSSMSLTEQTELFRKAADGASTALSTWLGRRTRIMIREVRRVSLERAVVLLGAPDTALVACPMRITGLVPGVLLLACDDASGLALAALLLERPADDVAGWDELAQSAAVETANIIGCAYLNAMVAMTTPNAGLLPSPPWFMRDYAGSIMEAVVMTQTSVAAEVFLTLTDFIIEDTPITCSLLFVPAVDPPD
jgi:chemotaxis protein CheC